jgi:hypothetical protein
MTTETTTETTTTYDDWTVDELRDELRGRQLPVSGTKPELLARLAEADRPPEDLTVPELQDELRERDLPVSGTKPELVDRLADADAEAPTGTATAQPAAGTVARSDCVVDDGTPHTGRAVNGVICSAHAMRYRADGTPR